MRKTTRHTHAPEPDAASNSIHEEIAALAYSYWRSRNGADGSAEEDWLRAEIEVTRRHGEAKPAAEVK